MCQMLPRLLPKVEAALSDHGLDIWTLAQELEVDPHDIYRALSDGWYWFIMFNGPDEMNLWLALVTRLQLNPFAVFLLPPDVI